MCFMRSNKAKKKSSLNSFFLDVWQMTFFLSSTSWESIGNMIW